MNRTGVEFTEYLSILMTIQHSMRNCYRCVLPQSDAIAVRELMSLGLVAKDSRIYLTDEGESVLEFCIKLKGKLNV